MGWISVSTFVLAVLVILMPARSAAADKDLVQVNLGEVYVVDGQTPLLSVAGLLQRARLDGLSSWVRSVPMKEACVVPLAATRTAVCENGYWTWHESLIELVGSEGTIREIKGANELPDILNRPLTGSISNRTEEVRIAQIRQQVSQAIADCREQQRVLVCVRLQTLVDPQVRVKGYGSAEEAKNAAQVYASKLGLRLGDPDGPDKDGVYLVRMKGEIISHGVFQRFKDGEPRFGSDRLFYLGEKASACVSVEGGTNGLIIRVDGHPAEGGLDLVGQVGEHAQDRGRPHRSMSGVRRTLVKWRN